MRSRRAMSLATAAPPRSTLVRAVSPAATRIPRTSRRRRIAVCPSIRRASPNPVNRLVAASASSHGYAASSEGSSVCDPSARSCTTSPTTDGTSTSSATIPSQTMAGNERRPWTTGGQTTPRMAIPSGTKASTPTTTSIGPPGR